MSNGLLQRAVGWVGGYLTWVKDTLASDTARAEVLADLGVVTDTPAPLVIEDEQLTSIDAYRTQSDPGQDAFLSTWGDIMTVAEAIRGFLDASGGASDELLRQFFTLTGTEYVRLRYPTWYFWLRLLAVIEDRAPDAFYGDAGASPDVFTRVYDLLSDGYDVLGTVYETPEDDAGARRLAAGTLVPLAALLGFWDHTARKGLDLVGGGFGLPKTTVLQGWDTFEGSPTPIGDHLSESFVSFSFGGLDIGTAVQGTIGGTLAWVPRDAGGPGLFVALNGSANLRLHLGSIWKLDTKKSFPDVVDVLLWDSIDVNPGDAPTPAPDPAAPSVIARTAPVDPADPAATLAATKALLDAPLVTGEIVRFTLAPVPATPQQPYVLGSGGTRLEIGSLAVTLVIAESGVDVKVAATGCALVVQRDDGSGFVQQVLPASGVRLAFDLGLGLAFTPSPSFYLEGGSGLQVTLPLDLSLGPLRLQQLILDLAGGTKVPEGGIRFEASIGASVTLGKFTASVDRLGFVVTAGADDGSPPAIGFKEPSGIGLLLDASVVTGGGYLFRDATNGQYAGVLQLEFKGLTLVAIGLISELPNGDYSLLVIIQASNFPGIALPLGFRLTGIGGLIGLNRTVNVEALRSGLKQRSLDVILFPDNPVRDAPRIVSALGTIMPVLAEQTVVGLMARITWGVPTIVTIDLGLIYEGPNPSRLLILGQFKVALPSEDRPLVTLKMDALGVVDFGTNEVSVDAVLYDSKITRFTITGDMALRSRIGGSGGSTFAVAVGGLHPKFTPPAGFPELKRLTIGLSSSASAKLTLSAYLALTSNTAQVGARLDFLFKAAGFSVEGYLGFDALFTFSPFSFVVDMRAGVTLKWHGRTLLGVTLELTLSGPSPWRAAGKAKFEIWWFSKTVSFDRTFGGDEPPPELPPADPGPILLTALGDPRNWSDQLADVEAALVTLRETPVPAGVVRLHPLGDLSVRQRVVPLGIDISRFGSGQVTGERRFDVAALAPDGSIAPGAVPVLDEFAPAQFIDLSDDERLARPSFERMGAGVRVAVGGVGWGGQADAALIGDADLTYETVVVGVPDPPPRQTTVFVPDVDELRIAAAFGAVGRRARMGAARFRGEQQVPDAPEPAYAVVGTDDLAPVAMAGMGATAPSYTAARQALARHVAEHPELAGSLQVVAVGQEAG